MLRCVKDAQGVDVMTPGEILDGRYHLVRRLGSGGMGTIWEAMELASSRRVVIKALHDHLSEEDDLVTRFLREAQVALESQFSAHILEVLDVANPPDRGPYLVMEYLEGEDLARILIRERTLEIWRAADLVIQSCYALAEIHSRGIVHRDIKPENIFITRLPSGSEWVKLLDFGVAKFKETNDLRTEPLTCAGCTLGTPHYMSPEQVRASPDIDHRTDIYSMGVVLYEVLTGRRPYVGEDIGEVMDRVRQGGPVQPRYLRPEVSNALEDVVLRAMASNPDERFQDMFELASSLEPFAEDAPPQTIHEVDTLRLFVGRSLTRRATESSAPTGRFDRLDTIRAGPLAPTLSLKPRKRLDQDSTDGSSHTSNGRVSSSNPPAQ